MGGDAACASGTIKSDSAAMCARFMRLTIKLSRAERRAAL
jgi:hypothetical protein